MYVYGFNFFPQNDWFIEFNFNPTTKNGKKNYFLNQHKTGHGRDQPDTKDNTYFKTRDNT